MPGKVTYTHGSDNCAPCWRCKGTIYAFSVHNGKERSRCIARCSGCHAIEGAFEAPLDPTAAELREALDAFRSSEE